MLREHLAWLRIAAVLTDALALATAWAGVVLARDALQQWWPWDLFPGAAPVVPPLGVGGHFSLLALVLPVFVGVLHLRGSYQGLRRKEPGELAGELAASVGVATLVLLALLFALKLDASRTTVLGFAAASLPALVGSRAAHLAVLRRLRRSRFDPHRVLLVGDPADARPWLDAVERHPEWNIAVVGTLPLGRADLAATLDAQAIDEVYLTRVRDTEELKEVARLCDETGVRFSMDANFLGLRASQAELVHFDGWGVLTFNATPARGLALAAKRALDATGAAVGLVALAPVLALVALAVRADGGPALYVQERAGRYGRPFRMYKFRTMVSGADAQLEALRGRNEVDGPAFKMAEDPRVTRLGRLLRRSSVDELPQLWNVLRGEMSLVGPRPPLPEEVRRYERWQLRRLSMKPGLTCIWQVSGRSDLDFDRWMALDLEYIDNWSLWLDLRLLVRTLPAVLLGTGAR